MDVSERRADLVRKYEEGLDASFQLSFKAALIIAADGESVADLSAKPISLTRSVLSVSLASLSEKARVRDSMVLLTTECKTIWQNPQQFSRFNSEFISTPPGSYFS